MKKSKLYETIKAQEESLYINPHYLYFHHKEYCSFFVGVIRWLDEIVLDYPDLRNELYITFMYHKLHNFIPTYKLPYEDKIMVYNLVSIFLGQLSYLNSYEFEHELIKNEQYDYLRLLASKVTCYFMFVGNTFYMNKWEEFEQFVKAEKIRPTHYFNINGIGGDNLFYKK